MALTNHEIELLEIEGKYERSLNDIIKNAASGNPYAQYIFATLYKTGKGVEKNIGLYYRWMKKSADQKFTLAQLDFAQYCQENQDYHTSNSYLEDINLSSQEVKLIDKQRICNLIQLNYYWLGNKQKVVEYAWKEIIYSNYNIDVITAYYSDSILKKNAHPHIDKAVYKNIINKLHYLSIKQESSAQDRKFFANILNETLKAEIGISKTVEQYEKTKKQKEKQLRPIERENFDHVAIHELGHMAALISLRGIDFVEAVEIQRISCGTTYSDNEKVYRKDKTKIFYLNEIKICLAGKAAEEIFINSFGSGIASDIYKATDIARKMVATWTMSSSFQYIVFNYWSDDYQDNFVDELAKLNPAIQNKILDEINNIINTEYENCKKIIKANKGLIQHFKPILLRKRRLSAEEIKAEYEKFILAKR